MAVQGGGGDSPETYIVVKLVFSGSPRGRGGRVRLARVLEHELEASVSSAVWSLCSLSLYFSHRAMSENLAAVSVVWGVAWCWKKAQLGAILGSLWPVTLVRYSRAWCAWRCWRCSCFGGSARTRPTLELLGVLALWALVYGAWDAAAWHSLPAAKAGGFFHSAVVYFRFNILENRGAGWGTAPWSYYFTHLYRTMPALCLALGLGAAASLKRAWPVALTLTAFLALHLLVAHKELRFIVPVIPLACALPGVALSALPLKPARLGLLVLLAAALFSAWNHRALTMGEVGSYPERSESSAWDDFGSVNRLLLAASRQGDVCGLRIDAAHLAWTGGSTYLHAPAPLYMPGFPAGHGSFNYLITRPGSGGHPVATEGPWELVKLGPTCTPDPQYTWRLR